MRENVLLFDFFKVSSYVLCYLSIFYTTCLILYLHELTKHEHLFLFKDGLFKSIIFPLLLTLKIFFYLIINIFILNLNLKYINYHFVLNIFNYKELD